MTAEGLAILNELARLPMCPPDMPTLLELQERAGLVLRASEPPAPLTMAQQAMLDALKGRSRLATTQEMALAIGVTSRSYAWRLLDALRQMDLVERRGGHRDGGWRILT